MALRGLSACLQLANNYTFCLGSTKELITKFMLSEEGEQAPRMKYKSTAIVPPNPTSRAAQNVPCWFAARFGLFLIELACVESEFLSSRVLLFHLNQQSRPWQRWSNVFVWQNEWLYRSGRLSIRFSPSQLHSCSLVKFRNISVTWGFFSLKSIRSIAR